VSETTNGGVLPWDVDRVDAQIHVLRAGLRRSSRQGQWGSFGPSSVSGLAGGSDIG
jgi:hypothetical protein